MRGLLPIFEVIKDIPKSYFSQRDAFGMGKVHGTPLEDALFEGLSQGVPRTFGAVWNLRCLRALRLKLKVLT